MKRELERVPLPDEEGAAARTWAVVSAAFAEREPRPAARRSYRVQAAAIAIAAAAVAVAVSPAGSTIVRSVREAVGVTHSAAALVQLPAGGRLLVNSTAGPWIVSADGSKRLLGRYTEASWSPHGLFEVATRGHELAALDPKGNVRWSLERAGVVHDARWSPDGYRIAYLDGSALRVVAGDGTGDHLVAAHVSQLPPIWQSAYHVLAYVTTSGVVRAVNVDTGARAKPPSRRLWTVSLHGGRYARLVFDAQRDRTSVVIQPGGRTVFVGTGRIDGVAWAPDGRWLLLAWRTADQWVFVRTTGPSRIRAVSSISAQFHSQTFPRLATWCC